MFQGKSLFLSFYFKDCAPLYSNSTPVCEVKGSSLTCGLSSLKVLRRIADLQFVQLFSYFVIKMRMMISKLHTKPQAENSSFSFPGTFQVHHNYLLHYHKIARSISYIISLITVRLTVIDSVLFLMFILLLKTWFDQSRHSLSILFVFLKDQLVIIFITTDLFYHYWVPIYYLINFYLNIRDFVHFAFFGFSLLSSF